MEELQSVPVTGITVTGTSGATTITSDNGTLQLTATVTPANATNKTVTWSIVNGTGQATINSTGLVTAVSNGTVTARATANDGSGVVGSLVITISGQVIPVTGITVTGANGATIITSDNGTLQLTATVTPADATNKTVTWSIVNGTGQATINSTGLVTAVSNGTVTARATANDGSGVVGSLVITISGQVIPVTGITVTGANGATIITSDNGTLQLTATVTPADATNKTVTWSIVNGTGQATINSTGLVTAVSNGTVTARATANDGSGVVGSLVITISSQVIPVTGITVTGANGATIITSDNGTLQLTATVTPADATNKTVTWSIVNGTGQATINSTGLVTAVSNGTVTARATANDGSGVVGSLVITISGQVIPVTGITVTGANGATIITSDSGTLQLTATVAPSNATNKTVTWSIVNGTGQATINSTGLVTAVSNGTVTARATANDGSGVVGSLVITISSQVIPVTGITVAGANGATIIASDNGTLQLTATVTPADATNKTVTWSIVNGTGQATINSTGLVTAVSNGTVTARATANDGSGVVGSLVITISSQVIPVTGITVTGANGATTITSDKGTLQLTATVTPADATNKTVTWSIVNGTGQATINSTGLVTAISNGTVTARATANDGSGVTGTLVITITGQSILITRIDIASTKGEAVITTQNGTLQLTATVQPANATNQTVTWSIINGTGQATISPSGLVTALTNGTVTARATAADGSGIYGQLIITISNQFVAVAGITVSGEGGVTIVSSDDGTLQMVAIIAPVTATNKAVIWSISKGSGHATISETGLLTARSNGIVTIRATSTDGSSVFGERDVSLVNQIVKITAIKVKPKSQSTDVAIATGSLQLTAEIEPADATEQSVTWSVINGTGTATINEKGLLVGDAPGEVTVVASATDGSGVAGELTVMIDLVESIKIRYTRNEIVIQVPDRLIPAKVSLHNLHGSHVQTKVIDMTECVIDISGLMPGIYVVSVYNSIVHDAAKIAISY
ncbi:MAG: beta strand repeat-containing protein [Bacteroidales bacterium]